MDSARFDDLLRSFALGLSRRGALAALLGGPLGLLGTAAADAKKRKRKGKGKKKKKGRNTPPPPPCTPGAPCGPATGECFCESSRVCASRAGTVTDRCATCPADTVQCLGDSEGVVTCHPPCGA